MKNVTKASSRQQNGGIAAIRATWFEIGAVLFLVCAPHLGVLACWLFWGDAYQQVMNQRVLANCKTALAYDTNLLDSTFAILRYIPIILFIIWRSGRGLAHFGLVKPKVGKDILIGLGLSLIVTILDCFVHLIRRDSTPRLSFCPLRFLGDGPCCSSDSVVRLVVRRSFGAVLTLSRVLKRSLGLPGRALCSVWWCLDSYICSRPP